MNDVAVMLIDLLVAAYPDHVRARLADEVDGLAAAIDDGVDWLRDTLVSELSRPFPEQRRGPLEIFQEAMKFPTAVLERSGLGASQRDAVAGSALPGDVYDLAPASTRDLGEDVWSAHLSWGAAKAAALTGGRDF